MFIPKILSICLLLTFQSIVLSGQALTFNFQNNNTSREVSSTVVSSNYGSIESSVGGTYYYSMSVVSGPRPSLFALVVGSNSWLFNENTGFSNTLFFVSGSNGAQVAALYPSGVTCGQRTHLRFTFYNLTGQIVGYQDYYVESPKNTSTFS